MSHALPDTDPPEPADHAPSSPARPVTEPEAHRDAVRRLAAEGYFARMIGPRADGSWVVATTDLRDPTRRGPTGRGSTPAEASLDVLIALRPRHRR